MDNRRIRPHELDRLIMDGFFLDRILVDRVKLDRVILDWILVDRLELDGFFLDRILVDRVKLDRVVLDEPVLVRIRLGSMTAVSGANIEERHSVPLLRRIWGKAGLSPVSRVVGVLSLGAFGLWAVVLMSFGPVHAPLNLPWPLLALLFFASERFVVDLDVRQQTHSFSLSEIALLLALIFATPSDLLIGQALGAGLALSLRQGQRPIKLLFNLANFAFCAAVALVVFRRHPGRQRSAGIVRLARSVRGGLRVGSGRSGLGGQGHLADAARAAEHRLASSASAPSTPSWRPASRSSRPPSCGMRPLASWLLVVLGAMVYLMLRWNGRELRRHRSLTQLHESTRQIQSSFTLDDVATALLSTAREMFDAEIAELLLFEPEGGQGRELRFDDDGPGTTGQLARHELRLDPRAGVWARVAAESRGVLVRDAKATRAGEGPIGRLRRPRCLSLKRATTTPPTECSPTIANAASGPQWSRRCAWRTAWSARCSSAIGAARRAPGRRPI